MDGNTMQVLSQEDSRGVDPPGLVIARTVPLTLQGGQACVPIEVRNLAAEVLVRHDQEAPSLPVAARRRLLRQLDALEQYITRNGTVEIQASTNSPGSAKDMVDGCSVPSRLTLSGGSFVRNGGATLVQS